MSTTTAMPTGTMRRTRGMACAYYIQHKTTRVDVQVCKGILSYPGKGEIKKQMSPDTSGGTFDCRYIEK